MSDFIGESFHDFQASAHSVERLKTLRSTLKAFNISPPCHLRTTSNLSDVVKTAPVPNPVRLEYLMWIESVGHVKGRVEAE